jgi:hypothetical protein
MDGNEKPAPTSPGIQLPGVLAFEATLAPHETKTVALQVPRDYDFMLHCVTCRSDGPVLLKIAVAEAPGARLPAAQAPQPFTAALDAEYPGHLAALAGESLEEWTKKNADLTRRAWAGDDPAFLDLIGRDPRVVGSPLTVAKVVSWRTEVEVFAKYAT